ncbi:MAG: M20/M25/M40 family metallo-hydrolase [Solirubrobacteraceae bacterium]|nr:M20/M25/M40 family metallo-hydrolase [Solirubrobacteraceae bacterium]
MARTPRARLIACALTAGLSLTLAAPAIAAPPGGAPDRLTRAVTLPGITEHLQALQAIATANDGTRASGTPGYTASADYVAEKLEAAGLRVTRQSFDFPFYRETGPSAFERTAPTPTTYALDTDYLVMEYSGSGEAIGAVVAVDLSLADPSTVTSGCEASDFADFPAGAIALLQRGTCPFGDKAANAEAAGASGAIIMNQGNGGPDRTDLFGGTLGAPVGIPVVSVSFALGGELAQDGTAARISTQTESQIRSTENVIGDLAPRNARKAGKTVVVGAHLDSVIDGPGINDNGTGTSAILEIAEQLARGQKPVNPVRFGFWGAEEAGLLGSTHYVGSLTEAELGQIGLNLNFDMLGSPNWARLVYDGDGSDTGTAGPSFSGEIEQTFLSYFEGRGLATQPTAFDGRSDYGPFIDVGIPAGGLFSGAEAIKTAEQVDLFGGVLGEALDRCYHLACDTLSNIGETGLDQLSDGAAYATAVYAFERTSPGKAKGKTKAQKDRAEFRGPQRRR